MDDVDRMIFESLVKDLQCTFPEKVSSLGQFGSDEMVEGIVRCLWKCDSQNAKDITCFKLPDNPIERFRMATKISDKIKSLRLREQLGYQTLLYPNVFDSRRIFLALFEKFPKEKMLSAVKPLHPFEKLKYDVGTEICNQLSEEWIPEFCRFYDLQRIGQLWHPRDDQGSEIWASLDQKAEKVGQEPRLPPKIAPKPRIQPKPKLLEKKSAEEESLLPQKEAGSISQEKIWPLEKKIEQKRSKLAEKKAQIMELRAEAAQVLGSLSRRRLTVQSRDERLLKLAEDPSTSLEKLMHFQSEANERRLTLQAKFSEARNERLTRLEELNATNRGTENLHNGRLVALRKGIAAMGEMLAQRRRIMAKLQRECHRLGEEGEEVNGRANYLRRILEISAMVGKQNEEIRRTANAVQCVRREIDQLMGGLGRTFIAVDRWLGKQAERDPKLQRSYKLLVLTHQHCASVKECIADQGQLSREAHELTDKIEVEMQKSVDAQLEKLLNDLMLIRHENQKLERQIGASTNENYARQSIPNRT